MMEEGMSIKGSITLVLAKPTGEVEVVHKDNIIVNGGFDFVADAIGNSGSRPGVLGWIAVGTGTTAAAATQTALVTELKRNAATYAHTAGTKGPTRTASYAAGIMFDRVVFPVVNKGADDSLTAVFTFTMS